MPRPGTYGFTDWDECPFSETLTRKDGSTETISGTWRLPTSFEARSNAVQSDHTLPTPFERWGLDVGSDVPTVYKNLTYGGGEVQYFREYSHSLRWFINPYLTDCNPGPAWYEKRDNAIKQAQTLARKGLSGPDQMQLAATAGEAKKTAEMLSDSAGNLWKSMLAAKRGRFGEIPKILGMSKRDVLTGKFPANKWLEYQYGWRPLMSDCYTLHKKLADTVKDPLVIKSSHFARITTFDESQYGFIRVRLKNTGGIRVAYAAKITNEYLHNAQNYGLINPLSVAWELVPFSFAIDWGIPIGNVLDSLTATAGLEFLYGYQSEIVRGNYQCSRVDQGLPWLELKESGNYSWNRYHFKRQPYNGFALPSLYGRDNPFTSSRIANALAIARQLFTGRR